MNHSHSDQHTGKLAFGRGCVGLRQQMKLTQRELAKLLEVNTQDIQGWERGVHVPTPEQLKLLLALALQRHAFPPERAHEEIEQLWLSAGQQMDFEVFWMQAQLATSSTPPALLVPNRESSRPTRREPPRSLPAIRRASIGEKPSKCTCCTGVSRNWAC